MLTLNRNRQTKSVTGALSWSCVVTFSAALHAQLAFAAIQLNGRSDHLDQVSLDNTNHDRPTQEPSVLIRDDGQLKPSIVQPVRPSFTARPKERSHLSEQRNVGFEIPSSPTREDFTNPATDEFNNRVAGDGSSSAGTFAHETREPRDPFSAPEPLSPQLRSLGSSSTPILVAPREPRDRGLPPINRNDLRHDTTLPNSPSSQKDSDHRSIPQVDKITATPRFVDTRPAPPATMPDTSTTRFTPATVSPSDTFSLNKLQPPHQPARPIDGQVTAASYSQPVTEEPANGQKMAQLIVDRYSMDNAPEPLPGEPTSLEEMLQHPLQPQSRRPMVSQYWETWFDWASMQNALAYQEWLTSVSTTSSGEKGLLDAARSAADNQVLAAKIQLGKSQAKLMRFMPNLRTGLLPLPSDSPLVERYETHYEVYRARNMLPQRLLGIDQMLPQTLTLIENRAQTVQKAQAAIQQTQQAYSQRQAPLASVLEAGRVWRSSEQGLLASVTNYNQAIADYAFNVTRRHTTPEQTVAMLIGKPRVKKQQLPTALQSGRQQSLDSEIRRNLTAQRLDRPSNNRTAAAPSNFGSTSSSTQMTRQSWDGGTNNSPTRPASSKTGRLHADSSPSLSKTPRNSVGSQASRPTTASPAAFGSLSAVRNNAPATTSRSSTKDTSTTSRPAVNNGFLGTNSGSSTKPSTTPTKPARKPFPLPKRPKPSNNHFGGFGG